MKKFVVFCIKIACAVLRPFYPVKVYGDRNIDNKKLIIVSNHISAWDPVLYQVHMKHLAPFVYKSEFLKSKFLTWVLNGLDCVPINRGEADINATKSILRLLKDDRPIYIYPEGTRNPQIDCLQEFHTGAALFALKTKSPVRPLYIWDKAKCGHKNYIIVGDEFTLDEFYDQPLNRNTLESATEVIKNKVDKLRVELNGILETKGVKRRKRTKKELEKIKTSQGEDRENLST